MDLTMDDAFIKNIINTLKSWVNAPAVDTSADPACLTDFSTLVGRGIYDHVHHALDLSRVWMTPVAAK